MSRTKWNKELFVQKATEVHGGKYDYSKVVFSTVNDKVEVICNSNQHTVAVSFYPVAGDHIRKLTGCPECKKISFGKSIRESKGLTRETFLKRAAEVHGDRYDYSKVKLVNSTTKVEVICREHGSFFPTPQNHLNSGTGCPECGREEARRKRVLSIEEFRQRATEVHNGRYDYSSVKYQKLHDFISITCPTHGLFQQVAYDHLAGHGCNKCSDTVTKPHLEIVELLAINGIKSQSNVKIGGWEVDIFCPDLNVAIEYNGLRWHSEGFRPDPYYHLSKTESVQKEGITLIHIWEDDWLYNEAKTKAWLLSQLGVNTVKLNARDLVVEQIPWLEAHNFVALHHMQGSPSPCEFRYALKDKRGEIKAVMLFSTKTREKGSSEICLERFCSEGSVRGGFSKLLKAFLKDHGSSFKTVVSFSDRSWSKGEVYLKNGFTLESHSPPRYWWVKGQRRYDRRGFQKQFLRTKLEKFDPEASEAENCYANGYSKLYDCGISKWVLNLQ